MASTSSAAQQPSISRALEIVRNTEGTVTDSAATAVLERAISTIWQRIQAQPDSYVMDKTEFAVFNYYRSRFRDSIVAESAAARFWTNFRGNASEIDGYRSP